MVEELGDDRGIASALINPVIVHLEMGRDDETKHFLDRAHMISLESACRTPTASSKHWRKSANPRRRQRHTWRSYESEQHERPSGVDGANRASEQLAPPQGIPTSSKGKCRGLSVRAG